jgi:hypothetical protein
MIAGMPASGKSTFIAALRHVLLSGDTSSALVMARLADDERHLNRLQDRWLASETFERTREASEAWVRFHVTDRKTSATAEIVMPDLRGEVFERPAALGNCARDVFQGLTSSSGLLLFTNANRPDDANLKSDTGDLLDDEPPEPPEPASVSGDPPAPPTFQADLMPEEAKLVELLQAVNRRPQPKRRRRLGLAVSAWDVVVEGGGDRSPAEWLATSRPMLWQYVQNNPDLWDVRAYGVSAQGGQLPRDRERLQAIENASERIIVIGHGAAPHDPTAPVAWLMASG